MHWCMDETLALLAMIPFIGYMFRKLHVWYHSKMGHTCHEKHCDDTHAEHKYSPFARPSCGYQKVSEADMEYLRREPAPLKILVPVSIWDEISEEDVEERFGKDLVKYLHEEVADAGLGFVPKDMRYWYVNEKGELRVEVQNKVFLHDYECCEYGWRVEQ
jgi:hypothetical protein